MKVVLQKTCFKKHEALSLSKNILLVKENLEVSQK